MGRDQELKWLAFSLYPLSFFLYSPFKLVFRFKQLWLNRWNFDCSKLCQNTRFVTKFFFIFYFVCRKFSMLQDWIVELPNINPIIISHILVTVLLYLYQICHCILSYYHLYSIIMPVFYLLWKILYSIYMVRVQLVHHYKVILQQRLTLKFFPQKPVENTLFDFYLINV